MRDRGLRFLLLAAITALPSSVMAQTPGTVQDRWPGDLFDQPRAAPAAKPPAPAAPVAPRPRKPPQTLPADDDLADEPGAPAPKPKPAPAAAPAQPARAVACSGTFAKDSSHLKLASVFDSRNVVFTEVDGDDGTKLMASVLFPNDPKRRLEVLWNDEAARRETSMVVIGGQSTWTAPKGLRLGLPLVALEKLNGRPFRMRGFGVEREGAVVNWLGGAFDNMPGGCQAGVRLKRDAKASDAALAAANVSELMSSDPLVRAVKPFVAEIILGYVE